METLEKLFGTAARVKIARLFLFNPDTSYGAETIVARTQEPERLVKKELASLLSLGLIRKKAAVITEMGKHGEIKKRKVSGWVLNKEFMYVAELRQLLINTHLVQNSDIIKRLQRSGKMKLIVLAGIFIQNPESRLDLFIVGDNIRKNALDTIIKTVESEIGKELRYVWLNTEEFNYRVSMYDKLVRDILDFPHEKILNKLNNVA